MLLTPATAQDAPGGSTTAELEAIGTMISRGERAEAEQRLRSLTERVDSVRALLLLARLRSEREDVAGALGSLERARELAPNSEEVLSALAATLLAGGETLRAIEVLDALARLCPTVGEYHHRRGVALMRAGDTAAAVEALREAARLAPSHAPILADLGVALNARGQYPESRPILVQALSLAPEDAEAVAALAEAEAGMGELESAEAHAQRVLARQSEHARANMVLGMVRLKQDRYPEALEALLKAVEHRPDCAKAQYQLSLVYARLNDDANSRKHLELYRRRMKQVEDEVEQVRRVTGFSPSGMQP
jgi:tetratricopeptide (TPR) repeat protein